MESQREREILSALSRFNLKTIQESAVFFRFLGKSGISVDDMLFVFEKVMRRNRRRAKRAMIIEGRRDLARKKVMGLVGNVIKEACPDCGTVMMISENIPDNDSQWTCPNCRYGRYVPTTAVEEIRRLHIEAREKAKEI
jgi:predicted RNA-binding Zn-ribbon protein involved in translation (DUF1610 family)